MFMFLDMECLKLLSISLKKKKKIVFFKDKARH